MRHTPPLACHIEYWDERSAFDSQSPWPIIGNVLGLTNQSASTSSLRTSIYGPRNTSSLPWKLRNVSLRRGSRYKKEAEDITTLGFPNVVLTISICVVMGVRTAQILIVYPLANFVIFHLLLAFHNWMEATVPSYHVIGCFVWLGWWTLFRWLTLTLSNQRPLDSSVIRPLPFVGVTFSVFCVAIANGGCSVVAVTLCRTCSCRGPYTRLFHALRYKHTIILLMIS